MRFLTDADIPGTEKLSIWLPTEAWLEAPYEALPPLVDDDSEGPSLESLGVCKYSCMITSNSEVHKSCC